MESFEIMKFCNKRWNYRFPLFGVSISIICYNDGKSCIPLNFHYFNIKWNFFFFQWTRLQRRPKMKENSKNGHTFSTKIPEPVEGEGILGAPLRQSLVNYPLPGWDYTFITICHFYTY